MSTRKRIVVFGVTDYIYKAARMSLNRDVSGIICFSDNDKKKWGISYEKIKIVPPNQLLEIDFDYILIGAWYSYCNIHNQLIQIGIPEKKIMPLLEKNHLYLLTGIIEGFDIKAVEEIFVNGQSLMEGLHTVNQINQTYEEMRPVTNNNDVKNTDFSKYPLIAHACGGFVYGDKCEYTNSLEALQDALAHGFKMIECDVWGIQDGIVVLGSRLKMQYPYDINYTLLSLDVLLEMISTDSQNKVILDIKYNTMDDFYRILTYIEQLLSESNELGSGLRQQILIETFDEASTRFAIEKKWECILTDYRNREGRWLKKSAVICCKYGVRTVLVDADYAMRCAKYTKYLTDKNIDIICYTVDEIEDYIKLKEIGVTSVLTNFLRP